MLRMLYVSIWRVWVSVTAAISLGARHAPALHIPLGVRNLAQLNGVVQWFNNAKGYGFLGHDGGPDVFVHYSSIQTDGYKSLKEGEAVSFEIIQGEKGPQADQVTRKSA